MVLPTFLVEDNPVIRESLMAAMDELVDAEFVGAAEGEAEAIAWLATHQSTWKLAVVDLFLAEGSGLGVIEACRERHKDQKVILLSNYANAAVARSAQALGVDAVFDKSTELDDFFAFCSSHEALLSSHG